MDRRNLKIDPALSKAYFLDLLTLVEAQKPHEARAISYQVTHEGGFEKLLLQPLGRRISWQGNPN